MSILFTRETKLAKQEVMMMQKPKLEKKQKGKKMIDENEEYKKCIYCISYRKGECSLTSCPYLLDRAEFGQVQYKHFVKGSFAQYKNPYFKKRLGKIIKTFCGDLFGSPAHKVRFDKVCDGQHNPIGEGSATYIAILFLLTADNALWTMCKNGVNTKSFDFKNMDIADIHTDGYALFQVAKKISVGKTYQTIEEFGDDTLITDSTLKAIINATLIAKHGLDFMSLKK